MVGWMGGLICESYVCTQQIHWIYFEAFIAETYVQLATTDANVLMCKLYTLRLPTGWSAVLDSTDYRACLTVCVNSLSHCTVRCFI